MIHVLVIKDERMKVVHRDFFCYLHANQLGLMALGDSRRVAGSNQRETEHIISLDPS